MKSYIFVGRFRFLWNLRFIAGVTNIGELREQQLLSTVAVVRQVEMVSGPPSMIYVPIPRILICYLLSPVFVLFWDQLSLEYITLNSLTQTDHKDVF